MALAPRRLGLVLRKLEAEGTVCSLFQATSLIGMFCLPWWDPVSRIPQFWLRLQVAAQSLC